MKQRLLTILKFFKRKVNKTIHPNKTERSNVLTPDRIKIISAKLSVFMRENKPFLHFGYGLRDLADAIKIPPYQLSAYINRVLGYNFNDYLNQYRVRYCEDLIQKGLIDHLNLKGLAVKCGFNNRTTLNNAFKRFTGSPPAHYLKGWKKKHNSSF
ncbi:MAG TPA: helix-turn-helix domain-containing protein [Puia sp.]|jgi:AraC-like DNA-binding protein